MPQLTLVPFCFYYGAAAFLQTNDPDARLWTMMYAIPFLLACWETFASRVAAPIRRQLSHVVALFAIVGAASANNFEVWRQIVQHLLAKSFAPIDAMVANDETLREQLGLLIVAATLPWVCGGGAGVSKRSSIALLKLLIGFALSAALIIVPRSLNFSGDHCGGANSVPLVSIY